MPRPLRLIVNPTSGGGRAARLLPQVLAGLAEAGYEAETAVTRSLDHAKELAVEAAAEGTTVGAMGGDGLISAVATTMANAETSAPLALLPAGRGNDFVRALGFTKIDKALEVIAKGNEQLVDVGSVNGVPFVAVTSVGFDSVVLETANKAKRLPGSLSYPYAVIRELLRWKTVHFDVTIDGETISFDGYSVIVANGGYYGGAMHVAPGAKVDDGLFDIVMIKDINRLGFLREAAKVFKGKHVNSPYVIMRRGREVSITSSRDFALHVDGELVSQLPARLTLRPSALRVFVP